MAKHKFEIWQTEDRRRMFTNSRVLKAVGMKPIKDKSYKKVWEGEIDTDGDDNATLEAIYTKFNLNHPEGYRGRSLTTSDMINLDGKTYFTDDYGYKRLSRSAAAGNNG